jgi:hypothetical protein
MPDHPVFDPDLEFDELAFARLKLAHELWTRERVRRMRELGLTTLDELEEHEREEEAIALVGGLN